MIGKKLNERFPTRQRDERVTPSGAHDLGGTCQERRALELRSCQEFRASLTTESCATAKKIP
jgi:hypothetical protein